MHIIGGELKNQIITTPKGAHTRPTSGRLREALFNICQNYIEEARFLDLFAGSGAMGLEALSRGASFCTFVDNDRNSIKSIQANLEKMQLGTKSKVLMGNVLTFMERLSKEKPYTIIYADPPYDAKVNVSGEQICYSEYLLRMCNDLPILCADGMLFIEDSTAFQPDVKSLTNLECVNMRRSGRSSLLQFRRLTN